MLAREILLALQALVVLILAVHDWLPLGRVNAVSHVRKRNTIVQIVSVTALQTLPFAFGLASTLIVHAGPLPGWLRGWLWISYGAMFLGQVQAWWLPFLIRPIRAARRRASVTPNTLHLILHLATLAALIDLACVR